jgi:endonuclease/exonuclease/phosphatase family metal-dependent hydrolase
LLIELAGAGEGGLAVASHNTMHGVFLDALIGHYRSLQKARPLDVLCLQENRPYGADGETQANVISAALGGLHCSCFSGFPGLATLVHPRHEVQDSYLIELPRLKRLTLIERTYIRGGKTKQKYALVVRLRWRNKAVTVVNFHLDTAGDHEHRHAQVGAIAKELGARGVEQDIVACGDTNAFTWQRTPGLTQLSKLMAPLNEALGTRLLVDGTPTHYFARQREDLLTHRLLTVLGRIGIDHPLPYDVICSDRPPLASGKLRIDESDHDLVFAVV